MLKERTIQTKWGSVSGWETPFGLVVMVNPKWLDVDNGDKGYQREFDRKWAEKIAANWDRHKFRPVNLRLRQGLLYVTNGQHTANAAVLVGVDEVLAIVNNGSESRQDEAREYVSMQRDVKRMRPYDTYRASLIAGDEDALILRKVTNELGITVGPKRAPGVLSAIKAARDIALYGGEEALRSTLAVSLLWNEDDLDRFKYEVLMGIAKALDANSVSTIQANAKRTSAHTLFTTANSEAAGKGYVTISNIAAILGKKRRNGPTPSVIRES